MSLNLENLDDAAIHDPEELRSRSRSPLFFVVAFLAALIVTAIMLGGYFYLRSRHVQQTLAAEKAAQQQAQAQAKSAPPPELKIYEDQAMIKGAQVVVGGTVENISNSPLTEISLELELTRRADGGAESRTLALAPKDLAPGQQGKYSLTVLSKDYKRARIVRVSSAGRTGELAFTTAQGNQRPAGPPQQNPKTIIVNRPPPREGDFINTPDTPTTIR